VALTNLWLITSDIVLISNFVTLYDIKINCSENKFIKVGKSRPDLALKQILSGLEAKLKVIEVLEHKVIEFFTFTQFI